MTSLASSVSSTPITDISTATTDTKTSTLFPTVFLSHGGGPCWFMTGGMFKPIDSQSPSADFMRNFMNKLNLPRKPEAILIVSAHWEAESGHGTNSVEILDCKNGSLYFDYYGFPPETYKITWPAPCASEVQINRVQELLRKAGFNPRFNSVRTGYDHGVFVPLKIAIPKADIPIIQVSLLSTLDPQKHLALGRALAPLREENILIIGSGFATHNLSEMSRGSSKYPQEWASKFDSWLATTLTGKEHAPTTSEHLYDENKYPVIWPNVVEKIVNIEKEAPYFQRAHPRTEHFLPLYVALGAAEPKRIDDTHLNAKISSDGGTITQDDINHSKVIKTTRLFSQIVMETASLASYRFD